MDLETKLERLQAVMSRPRTHRRILAALAVVFLFVAADNSRAPYAAVTPGPTPDVAALVAAAQPGQHATTTRGKLLATTIIAQPMTWLGLARCSIRKQGCIVEHIDTSAAQSTDEAQAMGQSISAAAAAARAIAGPKATGPAALTADLGDVQGPSAGLMLTLAFLDQLTGSDLTGGATIAGTGVITPSGVVGPIGGITYKVTGAYHSGARVFLAPAGQAAAARGAAPAGLTVIGVSTAQDAVTWLCGHGGTGSLCRH